MMERIAKYMSRWFVLGNLFRPIIPFTINLLYWKPAKGDNVGDLLSIIIYRPFCKYICPLGAIYSIFNPISIFRYRLDKDKCINCGKCKKVCQMNIDPVENCNHLECIRCGRCKNACPVDAISYGVRK